MAMIINEFTITVTMCPKTAINFQSDYKKAHKIEKEMKCAYHIQKKQPSHTAKMGNKDSLSLIIMQT